MKSLWPNAENAAPKKCECGVKLPKPKYGKTTLTAHPSQKSWHIICPFCHTIYLWSFPNIYIKHSKLAAAQIVISRAKAVNLLTKAER